MGHPFQLDFNAGLPQRALRQQAFRDFGGGISRGADVLRDSALRQSERDQQNLIFKLLREDRKESVETAFGRDKELIELRNKLLLGRQQSAAGIRDRQPIAPQDLLGDFSSANVSGATDILNARNFRGAIPSQQDAGGLTGQAQGALGGARFTNELTARTPLPPSLRDEDRTRQATLDTDRRTQTARQNELNQKKFDLAQRKEDRQDKRLALREKRLTALNNALDLDMEKTELQIQNLVDAPSAETRKAALVRLRDVRKQIDKVVNDGANQVAVWGPGADAEHRRIASTYRQLEQRLSRQLKPPKGPERGGGTVPPAATPAAGVQAPPLSDKNKIRRGIPAFQQFQQAVDAGAEADPAGAESARGIFDRRRSGNEVNFTREYMLAAAKEIRAGKAPVEVAHIIGSRIGIEAFPVQDSDGIAYFLAALGHEQLVKQGVTKFSLQDILGPVKRELMGR